MSKATRTLTPFITKRNLLRQKASNQKFNIIILLIVFSIFIARLYQLIYTM